MFPDSFVLMDTEFTADADSQAFNWSRPGEHREVIQIGAVRVNGPTFDQVGAFRCYVKPVLKPVLSDFIIELTGITQQDVDTKGLPIAEAAQELKVFADGLPIYSYGDDGGVISANCKLLGVACPLSAPQFHDLAPGVKQILTGMGVDVTKYSSGTLLKAFGFSGGRAHDALADMENLLVVLKHLRAQGRL